MLEKYQKSPSIQFFLEGLSKKKSFLIEGLWDSPKALLIALAHKVTKKNIIILSGGVRENRLFTDFAYLGLEDPLEFPSWETLPEEGISPSSDIMGRRVDILQTLLAKKEPSIVITSVQGVLQKVLAKDSLSSLFQKWKPKEEIPFDILPTFLPSLGYKRSSVVSDKGEFAIRGGILDIFPYSSLRPYRVEFFGDAIDNIRTFDAGTQKSIEKVSEILLSPSEEFFLRKEVKSELLLDYLGKDTIVFFDDLLALEDNLISLQSMKGFSSSLLCPWNEFLLRVKQETFSSIFCTNESIETLSQIERKERGPFSEEIQFEAFSTPLSSTRWFHPFAKLEDIAPAPSLATFLEKVPENFSPKTSFVFLYENEREEKNIQENIQQFPLQNPFTLERGYLSSSFSLIDIPLVVVTERTFSLHSFKIHRQKWRTQTPTPISLFHTLSIGDPVVHIHSGIGKYLGIEKQPNHLGETTEFLIIEYAEGSKLYVPLSQSHLISRYIGSKEEIPTLSTLGSLKWQKTKAHAQQQIVGYAEDLLRLYAERSLDRGFTYPQDSQEFEEFEEDFFYQETEDQLQAISSVKKDLTDAKPMDRLICGDVGYGKTEVAIRAAFKVAYDGKKQVAILVPTTVLAMQHHDTFVSRMKNYPLTIEVVSRFHTTKENNDILRRTKEGKVDILIGTHRLLSKDVQFKDLGLLIIDEEQRFGVRSKEHIKKLKKNVDCLTLSATPIPRTLYMSLIHIRDMSVINTPPLDRLPIKTIVCEGDEALIQNAILRELSRNGQIFYIHNRVETIYEKVSFLQKLVPQARVTVAHGQMDGEDLDQVFHQFKEGNFDILVATTLIENGIDIPNANTLLVERADTFGLADLYQLKGRVGRWNRSAYAYFLTPTRREISEISQKRLQALVEASGGCGGGMKVAMRDLEIRGAGDLLGVEQSGQISAIGFHLYCKLLARAIAALQAKKPVTFVDTKMEFPYRALLPESYIDSTELRLEMYHKLGEALSWKDVDAIFLELQDRFGAPPKEALFLYHMTRIRVFAALNRFTHLKFTALSVTVEQGKTVKTFFFSKPFTAPEKLEAHVIEQLKGFFYCPETP